MTISLRRARVRATFIRRVSARKPISPFGVRADERNDDRLFLAALKAIDRVDLQAVDRQLLAQQADLRGVGRDHGDVRGDTPASSSACTLPADELGLRRIAAALAIGLQLLVVARAGRVDERQRRAGQRRRRHAGKSCSKCSRHARVGDERAVVKLLATKNP